MPDVLQGGLAEEQPDSKYRPDQLRKGVKVEKEHTPAQPVAKEIAKDHLEEIPDYYDRLAEMEAEAKKTAMTFDVRSFLSKVAAQSGVEYAPGQPADPNWRAAAKPADTTPRAPDAPGELPADYHPGQPANPNWAAEARAAQQPPGKPPEPVPAPKTPAVAPTTPVNSTPSPAVSATKKLGAVLQAKRAAYYMRPGDAEEDKPSFLGSMLGGAALGGLAGGLGGGAYGAYKGHKDWQVADPAYMQTPHRLGGGMTNAQVMGDPNAPTPVRAGVQAGRPSHAGMVGSQALSSSWRPALVGAGTGAALGLLRYLLSR